MTVKSSFDEILSRIRIGNENFFYPIKHGTMRVGLYVPIKEDKQKPHSQDEIYIIHRGEGQIECDGVTVEFKAGDVLFVKANEPHRFKTFSSDFQTWVVFWGPEGGESSKK